MRGTMALFEYINNIYKNTPTVVNSALKNLTNVQNESTITVPISNTNNDAILAEEQKKISLFNNNDKKIEQPNQGLTIEKTTKTENVEVVKKAEETKKENQQNQDGPTFETQTMNWFKDTKENPELWEKLSEEEKQKRSNTALNGMIESYNENQVRIWNNISNEQWKKLSDKEKQNYRDLALNGIDPVTGIEKRCKQMTVAEQYEKYVKRCTSKEQVIRLTRTVKSMDKDNQIAAFKDSYEYKNKDFRDAAERILSNDYTELHEDNVPEAARIIVKNSSKENVLHATDNAFKTPVKKQAEVVYEFMQAKNEKVDLALSNQIGKFGVKEDGTIDKEVQLDCFGKLTKSEFQAVIENTAKNIYQLHSENQRPATQIIIDTKNEGAINVAASQIYKCSKENQEAIKYDLKNTGYTSVNNTLAKAETQAESITKETSSNTQLTTSDAKVKEVVKLIQENKANTVELENLVKNLSQAEKIALIRECSANSDVLWAIFESNPSLEVLSELGKHININELKNSRIAKLQFGFLGTDTQIAILENSSFNELLNINRNELNVGTARNKYDELLEKGKKEHNIG